MVPRVLGVLQRVLGVPHRVLGVLQRVRGVLYRVLGVSHMVLGVLRGRKQRTTGKGNDADPIGALLDRHSGHVLLK